MIILKAGISREIKEEILGKVKAGESVKNLSVQDEVSDKSIYAWLKAGVTSQISFADYSRILKENRQPKEIVGVLTYELSRVKKRQIWETILARVQNTNKVFVASLLGVCRKTVYLSQDRLKLPDKNQLLKEQILSVLANNPAYGHRRIALALKVGRKRVRRVMKLYGIKPFKRRRKWIKAHDFGKQPARYTNLIKGSFPIKPQVVYVGDFTYLRYNGSFIYFATLMDQFTREIVGWNVSARHTKEFVINTLLDAIKTRGRPYIVHTDQGSEYNSKEFTTFAQKTRHQGFNE